MRITAAGIETRFSTIVKSKQEMEDDEDREEFYPLRYSTNAESNQMGNEQASQQEEKRDEVHEIDAEWDGTQNIPYRVIEETTLKATAKSTGVGGKGGLAFKRTKNYYN